jgi:hypothetical protein
MIQKFIKFWEQRKHKIREQFEKAHPESYEAIVKAVVEILGDDEEYDSPDPERITVIDHGHYQGTLVFIIASKGYQPYEYWAVMVGYGSCSVCDTLAGIRECDDGAPNQDKVEDYMTLALHIVQDISRIGGE